MPPLRPLVRPVAGSVAGLAVSLLLPAPLRPVVVALLLAVFTRRPALSMTLGAIVGVLSSEVTLVAGFERHWIGNVTDTWHLCAMGFALTLLGLVRVMSESGGTGALLNLVARRVASRRGAKLSTAVAGLLVFFDDYANALMVGPTLRPLTDRFGVSREKLAYLVDSTAAPVAGLAVMSTWIGYEVGLFQEVVGQLGVTRGGYALLLAALPYRFYCVFALALVFLVSGWERDFVPMFQAECRASDKASSAVERKRADSDEPGVRGADEVALEGRPGLQWNAMLPLGTLIVSVPLGILLDGGLASRVAAPSGLFSFSVFQESLMASENNVQVLFFSGLLAVAAGFALPALRGNATASALARAFAEGVKVGFPPLLILISAWALSGVCKDLNAGDFLVKHLGAGLGGQWLPVGSFLLSAAVAFATGTSWGTMAIVIPAIAPVALSSGGEALLIVALASVLDGAIFGDHCSPISDTTVMTCVATGCDLMDHVRTQLPYALCAMVAAAACGYLQVAGGGSVWIAYPLGLSVLVAACKIFGRPLTPADVSSG